MEGLGLGAKSLAEGGGAGAGAGGSGGVGGKDDVWDEERLCEGLRRLEEMHSKVYIFTPLPAKAPLR